MSSDSTVIDSRSLIKYVKSAVEYDDTWESWRNPATTAVVINDTSVVICARVTLALSKCKRGSNLMEIIQELFDRLDVIQQSKSSDRSFWICVCASVYIKAFEQKAIAEEKASVGDNTTQKACAGDNTTQKACVVGASDNAEVSNYTNLIRTLDRAVDNEQKAIELMEESYPIVISDDYSPLSIVASIFNLFDKSLVYYVKCPAAFECRNQINQISNVALRMRKTLTRMMRETSDPCLGDCLESSIGVIHEIMCSMDVFLNSDLPDKYFWACVEYYNYKVLLC